MNDLTRAVERLAKDCEDGTIRHYTGRDLDLDGKDIPYTLSDLRLVLPALATARAAGVEAAAQVAEKESLASSSYTRDRGVCLRVAAAIRALSCPAPAAAGQDGRE